MNESSHTYEWVISYIWTSHVIFDRVTSHIRTGHVTHMNASCHTYKRVMSLIRTTHVTHSHESRHTYEQVKSHIWMGHDMGWLRWVGSLKLQVFFAEYSLFYRALLKKRPIILRSLLIVATPYERGHDMGHAMKYRSLLQNIVSFIGLFCKRDLYFSEAY